MSASKVDRVFAAFTLLLLACYANGQNLTLTPASAATNTGTASVVQFPQGETATPPAPAVPATTPATPDATPTPAVATTAATPAPVTPPAPATTTKPPTEPQEPTPTGPAGTFNLNPFHSIVSCVPFNILVSPSSDSTTYSVTTALSAELEAAVRFRVQNNTLYVGFNRSFETALPIKVNITLPPASLVSVTNSGFGDMYLNEGFATDNTTITAYGTGSVLARSLNTTTLTVVKTGVADVFAKGAITAATVSATGTGSVTIAGVQQAVSGSLDGIVSLFVDGATDQTAITVEANGLSKVHYTQGKCEAGKQVNIDVPFFSLDLGLSSCLKTRPDAFPRYKAFWSCGMKVKGDSMCTPAATEAAEAAADSADISINTGDNSDDDTPASTSTAAAAAASSTSSSSPSAAEAAPAGPAGSSTTQAASSTADASGSVSLLRQGPSDPTALQLSEAADIGLDTPAAAGRRLRKFLWFPEFDLPTFPPFRTNDDDDSSDDNTVPTVTVSVARDGSRTTSGRTERVSVKSVECSAQQQELFIPARYR